MTIAELRFSRTAFFLQQERRKNKEIYNWLWLIISWSIAIRPVLPAVGLLFMKLHSSIWTYPSQMQVSRTVSTSNTFIKPWYAFAQGSMRGAAHRVADCLQESKIQLQVNHVTTRITHRVLFDMGYHFSTGSEIINKYIFLGVWSVCLTSHSSHSHWYLRICGWKTRDHQSILYTHVQHYRGWGAFPPITGEKI